MLRTIFISLWACGVTAGTLFYFLSASTEKHSAKTLEAQVEKKPTYSEPLIVFAPILSKAKVSGYLFANLAVRTDTKILEETKIPLKMLIQDAYVSYLIGNQEFALPKISTVDNQKLKMGIKKKINELAGGELVEAIYASDINYLQFRDVRGKDDLGTLQLHEQAHKKKMEAKKQKPKIGH